MLDELGNSGPTLGVECGNREPTTGDLEFLLDGLDDDRWTYDPYDPPGFDWGGGGVVAGNSTQYRISEAAVASLRKVGGAQLRGILDARLGAASAAAMQITAFGSAQAQDARALPFERPGNKPPPIE